MLDKYISNNVFIHFLSSLPLLRSFFLGINRPMDDQLPIAEENGACEVLSFPGATSLDIPPSDVLEGALEQGLEDVIVIGFKEDGALYLASSSGDLLRILGTLNMAKFTYLMSSEG